ncbi:MAG: tRNA lysidine(34) synthetase TilS [Patescibacteria group bacterium]
MINQVFPILTQYFSEKVAIVVGVSGGPDSTALLDLLVEFFAEPSGKTDKPGKIDTACKIIVAHVNHGIRGVAAKHDENFVRNLAKKYELKFEVKRVKLADRTHQEERGRQIRRDFFEKLRAKYKARWIFTAHTADDQVETIIFNFLRGSGVNGLAGMDAVWGNYQKPLLGVTKAEILSYLKSKKLKYCTDATNSDTEYSRNFIRRKIIPLISKLNPAFKKTLIRNAEIFRNLEVFLEDEAGKFLARQKFSQTNPTLTAKEFLKLPRAIQQAVIQAAFLKFTKNHYQLSATKTGEILNLIERNVGNKKIITGKNGATFSLYKGIVSIG